jgi:tetratricopeptide (TPR) repeat protein
LGRLLTVVSCAVLCSAVNIWADQGPTQRGTGAPAREEPAEFTGLPKAVPPPPSPVLVRFAQSDTIRRADTAKPDTIAPALAALDAFVQEAPMEPAIRWMRAGVLCETAAPPQQVLEDLAVAASLLSGTMAPAFVHVQSILTLKAKMELRLGQYDAAMRDLDAAIREDFGSASEVFNDGMVEPRTEFAPCAWTLADIDALSKRLPNDHRPHLYQGLYRTFYLKLQTDGDPKPVIDAYERASKLNPASPLPHYFLGMLHAFGSLGGIMSMKNAQCIDDVVPRTKACLELDEIRRLGLRHFTRAIAADTAFEPAYSSRAAVLLRIKEYRQAIRDYDKALTLKPDRDQTRIIYNDRALAKMQLKEYQSAIADLDRSIAFGCDSGCGSYQNRAEAYLKLGDYSRALADIGASIKQTLTSAVYLMNIDKFRQLYPEYDDMADDDVLTEKLRALLFPEMAYVSFAKQFLVEAKMEPTFVLSDFYLKRGDIYMKLGRTRQAEAEYDRVSRVFPTFAEFAIETRDGRRVRVQQ